MTQLIANEGGSLQAHIPPSSLYEAPAKSQSPTRGKPDVLPAVMNGPVDKIRARAVRPGWLPVSVPVSSSRIAPVELANPLTENPRSTSPPPDVKDIVRISPGSPTNPLSIRPSRTVKQMQKLPTVSGAPSSTKKTIIVGTGWPNLRPPSIKPVAPAAVIPSSTLEVLQSDAKAAIVHAHSPPLAGPSASGLAAGSTSHTRIGGSSLDLATYSSPSPSPPPTHVALQPSSNSHTPGASANVPINLSRPSSPLPVFPFASPPPPKRRRSPLRAPEAARKVLPDSPSQNSIIEGEYPFQDVQVRPRSLYFRYTNTRKRHWVSSNAFIGSWALRAQPA